MRYLSTAIVLVAIAVVSVYVLEYALTSINAAVRSKNPISLEQLCTVRNILESRGEIELPPAHRAVVSQKHGVIKICDSTACIGLNISLALIEWRAYGPVYNERSQHLLLVWANGTSLGLISNVMVLDSEGSLKIVYVAADHGGCYSQLRLGEESEILRLYAANGSVITPYGTYGFTGTRKIIVRRYVLSGT